MAKKRKRRPGICAYCGEYHGKLTHEHVFPTALFDPKPPPSERIVLPVCQECNNDKARFDGEFRDSLIMTGRAWQHPHALRLISGKHARATKSNRSRVGRAIDQAVFDSWVSSAGVLVPKQIIAKIDPVPIVAVLSHIAIGLVYHLTGQIAVNTHLGHIKELSPIEFVGARNIACEAKYGYCGVEGEDVAQWAVLFSGPVMGEVPAFTCVARFYRSRAFLMLAGPKFVAT